MTEKEKQIEEMAKAIFESGVAIDGIDCAFAAVHGANMKDSHFMRIAKHLVCNKGYRKQVEGEWIRRVEYNSIEDCDDEYYQCSVCGLCMPCESNFCMDCGAKMKGGESDDRN